MPDLPLVTIVTAALAVTLAYTVFGLTGFGAAIVGVPLLAHVVPIRFAVSRAVRLRPLRGLFGLQCAMSTAASCFASRPSSRSASCSASPRSCARPTLRLLGILGTFVFGYASWSLLRRGAPRPIGAAWAMPAGMAGGVFTALYGSGGPSTPSTSRAASASRTGCARRSPCSSSARRGRASRCSRAPA